MRFSNPIVIQHDFVMVMWTNVHYLDRLCTCITWQNTWQIDKHWKSVNGMQYLSIFDVCQFACIFCHLQSIAHPTLIWNIRIVFIVWTIAATATTDQHPNKSPLAIVSQTMISVDHLVVQCVTLNRIADLADKIGNAMRSMPFKLLF